MPDSGVNGSRVPSVLENEIQSPPTLDRVAQANQAAFRMIVALNPGETVADITSTLVREGAEGLLRKAGLVLRRTALQNAADHAMLVRDHKSAIESLKNAIARQKEVTASMEATLAVLEAIHGIILKKWFHFFAVGSARSTSWSSIEHSVSLFVTESIELETNKRWIDEWDMDAARRDPFEPQWPITGHLFSVSFLRFFPSPSNMPDVHPFEDRVVTLRDIITEDPQSWDVAWKTKVTPWDSGEIQPPLRDVIQSGEVTFPKGGRALVPGCGRVECSIAAKGLRCNLSRLCSGHEAVGLDASTTAFDAANELRSTSGVDPELLSKIHFENTDFFSYKVPEDKKFDLIYDFTFFVAIPPSKRSLWGSQMNALIKPEGYLITLMFPQVAEPYSTGPPFWTNLASYEEVLGDGWEIVLNKVPDDAILNEHHRGGKDRMVVRRRKM
ncbi:hypothetical protein D9757_006776 [Collybiopsis confluens]|uniref:S-adenosyl-L-methionine-dependent methyltransferase n=1 Tax=Collybiopsis confluens TaxID=2823264 RepID=A0A8H5HM19_9AGAR|nr:hypothetical protein D9757_006776 [Collybiopsis confluens]